MNIVLLSGGSGKRLWPLSNDVKSKQFLKILKNVDNTYESMVQRVYHQILNVDKNANITIATSNNQVPILKNQLGNNISISIEPCRKDTFPAIVLACMYLVDVKKIDINEVVTICPVDPYVNDGFFVCLKELEEKMKQSSNNIGLIGIQPTYPSEKYGYIVVNTNFTDNTESLTVDKFIEKPTLEKAKELVDNKALWNGGVFCFRLKYIIDKAHELIDFIDYNDLYNKYSSLNKISFDYAIVEKEKQIDVVKYSGGWKDIGTWNTLTEVMDDNKIGNVLFDDKSKNSHIVNELSIPIIAMGLENMVVAASYDGIFVSSKEQSSFNKPLVEKLDNRPMSEEREWGSFQVLSIYDNSLVKHLVINKGKHLSYQKHNYRDEVWTIINGAGTLIINDEKRDVKKGDVIYIKKGDWHSLIATEDLRFVEVQYGDRVLEEDIERKEYNF